MTAFKLGIDQTIKPTLLLMFFAGVGMCADLRQLGKGGKALVIFLLVLFPYILVQNVVGIAAAKVARPAPDLRPGRRARSRWSAGTAPAPPTPSASPR